MLRKIRITIAIITFSALTFYFLDFAGIAPSWFRWFAKLQFLPNVLAQSIWIACGILLVTLVFGRIYCSVICPLGIIQDIFLWLSRRSSKRLTKKNKVFSYSRQHKLLRWSVLTVCVVAFITGFNIILVIVEPYSAYGRIAANIFDPIYNAVNNMLASIFTRMDIHTFYKVEVYFYGLFTFLAAIATLFVVGYMAWRRGRLYCNTICPVGTILGFVSRFSFFKVRFNKKCNTCGLCSMNCKAQCIDSKNQTIDYSRCVACFDCLDKCNKSAMKYSFSPFWKKEVSKKKSVTESKHIDCNDIDNKSLQDTESIDEGRRRFILTALAVTAATPVVLAKGRTSNIISTLTGSKEYKRQNTISPPGSLGHDHLNSHCTACHLCISKCPSNILKPSVTGYGFKGIMQPEINFKNGFCAYDCTVCGDVCPNGAILPLTKSEKHRIKIGYATFTLDNCLVSTKGVNCGACSEVCPKNAIAMSDYEGDLQIPRIRRGMCIGCGACEYICPATPFKAIVVEGNKSHSPATKK